MNGECPADGLHSIQAAARPFGRGLAYLGGAGFRLAGGVLTAALLAGCSSSPAPLDAGASRQPSGYKVSAEVVPKRPSPYIPAGDAAAEPSSTEVMDSPDVAESAVVSRMAKRSLEQDLRREDPAPQRTPEEEFLLRVARERPLVPAEGAINGEPVVASCAGGNDQCRTVVVTSPARRLAEMWQVCANGEIALERQAEPTPAPPNDPGLQTTRQMVIFEAHARREAALNYGEFVVSAKSAGQPDAKGCTLVRCAVSWQGIVLDLRDEHVCSPNE